MTLHQAADLGVAAVIFGVKAVGWCFGRLLDAIIGDALGGLVRAVYRRLKPPVLTGFEGFRRRRMSADVPSGPRSSPKHARTHRSATSPILAS